MANDSVTVQYEGLLSASSGFMSSAQKLETTVSDLNSRINSLLNSFTGSTATNFRTNQAQLNNGMTELRGVITQLSQVLSEAEATYRQADSSAAGLFS